MDAKLPMDIFENVMQLAVEGCKAVAQYIREVREFISNFPFLLLQSVPAIFPLVPSLVLIIRL